MDPDVSFDDRVKDGLAILSVIALAVMVVVFLSQLVAESALGYESASVESVFHGFAAAIVIAGVGAVVLVVAAWLTGVLAHDVPYLVQKIRRGGDSG